MMTSRCDRCNVPFKSAAALNFHKKKRHPADYQDNHGERGQNDLNYLPGTATCSSNPASGNNKHHYLKFKLQKSQASLKPFRFVVFRPEAFLKEEPVSRRRLKHKSTTSTDERVVTERVSSKTFASKKLPLSPIALDDTEMPPPRGRKRKCDDLNGGLTSSTPKKTEDVKDDPTAKLPSPKSSVQDSQISVPPNKLVKSRGSQDAREQGEVQPEAFDDTLSSFNSSRRNIDPDNVGELQPHSSDDSLSTSSSSRRSTGKDKVCPACGRSDFKNSDWYMNHLEIHEGLKPFVCPNCERGYETDIKLLEHMKRKHSTKEDFFTCAKCGKVYQTQKWLESHALVCT